MGIRSDAVCKQSLRMIMMSEREREEERRGKEIKREKERESARESVPARERDRKREQVHLSSRRVAHVHILHSLLPAAQ